jgi:hypothetical protein
MLVLKERPSPYDWPPFHTRQRLNALRIASLD